MDEMKTQLSNHRKNRLGERKEIKAENKEDVDTMESELEFFKTPPTGSFNKRVICYTAIQSFQKCFLRLILTEKSSLVHDI